MSLYINFINEFIFKITRNEILDSIDINILNLLQKDSRQSASSISEKVSLSIPAVIERIKKLEKSGLINSYTIKLNKKQLNINLIAFILISLDHSSDILAFRKSITTFSEVLECYHVAGQYDYVLKVCVSGTDELEKLLMNDIKKINGISSSNTLICLSVLKEEINVPLK